MFLKFFGLNEQPFGVTPDPRFLYMSPAHEEAFASLVYGIETGRGFVALIAGPGLGKTTVLLRLMERLQDSARTAFLFQTHLQSGEFLKSLFADLGVESAGGSLGDLQRQFSEVLIKESQAGKRVVVAIDEAQNLDDSTLETVRMLSNFETSQAKLLQIILVGQKELADKLARPNLEQLRQRVSIITHFPPFSHDEVGKYISHRLRVAGFKGRQLFTPAALRLIATHSGGIPRNINNLCFHALSLAFAKNQHVVNDATLHEVMADLNLRLLGTNRAGQSVAAGAGSGASNAGAGTESTPRPQPMEAPAGSRASYAEAVGAGSPLDGVDLSSYETGDVNVFRTRPGASTRRGAPPRYAAAQGGRGFRVTLLALVLLIAAVWAAPRLKAGIEYLVGPIFTPTESSTPKPPLPHRDHPSVPPADSQTSDTAPALAPTSAQPAGSENANHGATSLAPASEGVQPQGRVLDLAGTSTPEEEADATASPARHSSDDLAAAKFSPARATPGDYPKRETSVDDLGAHGVQGLLVVESSESGAHISVNGRSSLKWVTPHIFSLARGTYNVVVIKAGYRPWSRQVRVEDPTEKWLTADLLSAEGATQAQEAATLRVETDPPGMQVWVDGKAYGSSRVETELPAGWHVCEVLARPGTQPLVSRFHLESGEILTKRIRITTLAAAPSGGAQVPPPIWNETRKN